MADKLKDIFGASQSHGSQEPECTGKEVGTEVTSFQFLWPRHCMPSGCSSSPLDLQRFRDPDSRNNVEVSLTPRSSKSADANAITSHINGRMYRDVNGSDVKMNMLKTLLAPYQEAIFSKDCREGLDLNPADTSLPPFLENMKPRSALDLRGPAEIFPLRTKRLSRKRKQVPLFDSGASSQEHKFQRSMMESGTLAYAGSETSEKERFLLESGCQGGQLPHIVVMHSHANGFKDGNNTENGSADFDASRKNCNAASTDLLDPKYVGKLNIRSISCIDMRGHCSFSTRVTEEKAVTSAPCHSMCRHNIQGRFTPLHKEDTTTYKRVLDSFFDDGHVMSSSGFHMQTVPAGRSSILPLNPESFISKCNIDISNPARSLGNQYESKTGGGSLCAPQRVPNFPYIDRPDQNVLRPFKCFRAEQYIISESKNRINSFEERCECQERTITYGSRSGGNELAAGVVPNEGSSNDFAQRGLSSHEPDKNVAFGETEKENPVSSPSPQEKVRKIRTETGTLDMNKGKRPILGDTFLEGGEGATPETGSKHGKDPRCHTKPERLDNEDIVQTVETPEQSSKWVKRLQSFSMDSFALGTNSFNMDHSPNSGQVQKLFTRVLNYSKSNSNLQLAKDTEQKKTGTSMAVLVNDKDSPVELLKRSYPWIRRWCRASQEHGHSRSDSEDQLYSRREIQAPCRGLDEEKRFPSAGAWALMGKAATNFRPCTFKRRGPFIVWNTNGMSQE